MSAPIRLVRSEGLELATRRPPPVLAPSLRELQGYAERTDRPVVRRELAGLRVVVILELGPLLRVVEPRAFGRDPHGARRPGGFVAGLHEGPALTAHDGYQAGIELELTPVGARRLFGVPLAELTGRVVSLRELLPAGERDLVEELAGLPDWERRLDRVVAWAGARLGRARGGDYADVAWALGRIEASGGRAAIGPLARELRTSPRRLIERFRDAVGVTPRRAARIARFERLVTRLRSGPAASWSTLALELGYADQSHLVREVRAFTGLPPTHARAALLGAPEAGSEPAGTAGKSVQDRAGPGS